MANDREGQTILVIGGTTNGIGKTFVNGVKAHFKDAYVFAPTPHELDVRNPDSIKKWLDSKAIKFDYTLYAAGVKHLAWIRHIDMDELSDTFAVNVIGYINVLRELTFRQKGGRICAITSAAAFNPMRTSIDYCSSKAALHMAIRVAARELTPNWHITGIQPDYVHDSDMTKQDIINISALRGWTPRDTEYRLKSGGVVSKRDVAALAHWLLFYSPITMSGNIIELKGRA